MMTVKGTLDIGLVVDKVTHKDFVMRESKIADAIAAVEKAPAGCSNILLRVYKAAEQLVSIGTLTDITADKLLSLPEEDLYPILDAQDDLLKKQRAGSEASAPIEPLS